ncbi:mechanosensitive ion channel protein [Heyndrickxia shackletonii]|uniref:Mechanosensitive ion channel protein n=1 Tax=Heyndrickxia shackletonii TaxID=157838 RepID=A0A0Q3WYK7_9BACI|nr:mechanosensitive ion channel family protein [Heyndrickxia shackletonii]KQL54799.1 mechanosensitive ion channel protein [Heyndrickxia shackletonii]MBB2480434.1 mechanosensitive ion channel family protein [Bacillus sp. APMAM]NEZ01790.1 mechanosensitive ion channel family protein [Heyndrickxia shackletonii]RTZ57459.1 mechanosensitive ion channel family protein [Bacillus sp. SAJ1]
MNLAEKIIDFDWMGLLVKIGTLLLKVVVTYIIYIIIKAIGRKIIHTAFVNHAKNPLVSTSRSKTLEILCENIFSYVLVFIFFATVLPMFGIKVTALLAGAGIVGLAVGFGAQGLVSDVVTGFFLLLERQVDVDDYITTGNFTGVVEQVGLRTTQLRSVDGTLHYIPNRLITSLSNHSRGNMQALVDIKISDNPNIDDAITVIQKACDAVKFEDENIVEGPNVLGVQSFSTSEIVLRVIAKTTNGKQAEVERKLKKVIKETLDEQVAEA